jgi:hypothetical protein
VSAAELLALRFSPSLPMKKDGGEPIGPTTTTQGSFGDRRTRRELAGIGGSVAGWANVTAGKGECTVRSTTVRAEGVNAMS